MPDSTHALVLEHVGVRFGAVDALADVSLRLAPGEHLAIVGPSGSGKSTLLRCVAGLQLPDRGRVVFGDETWSDAAAGRQLPPERRRIGMLAQNPALWPHLSALRHLQTVLKWRGVAAADARRAEALRILDLVGLADRAQHRPAMLSGGEAQRLGLARALCGDSRVLLLDEPLAQLDIVLRRSLGAEIRGLARDLGTTVLHVTHDAADARRLADRIAVLEGGRLTHLGTADELLAVRDSPFLAALLAEG